MTQPFGHEKLIVYQAGLHVVAWLETMWNAFSCSADLRAKLDKATIQSVALVDVASANGAADVAQVESGRDTLRRIAAMLTALSKAHVGDSASNT